MHKFYGYKKCGTCSKAEKYLRQQGLDYTYIDITLDPPTAGTLRKIARQAGVEARKLFNTSGVVYREQNIKERLPGMNDEQIFSLLAGNGRLIKRPLISDGKNSTVGFSEAVFAETWG